MRIRILVTTSLALSFFLAAMASANAVETVELFNGKDLTGWIKRGGAGTYTVDNGEIVGHSARNTYNTFLATEKEFGDFVLELDFKISDQKFNSGVQIRSHSRAEKDAQGNEQERVYGYQVEIDPRDREDRGWTAGIYFEGGSSERKAGWLADLANNEAARKAFKLGEWNHLKVVCSGRHIQTWLNDVPAVDYTDNDEQAYTPKGFIALQVHGVGSAEDKKEVRWKNIKLTPIESQ